MIYRDKSGRFARKEEVMFGPWPNFDFYMRQALKARRDLMSNLVLQSNPLMALVAGEERNAQQER